MNLRTSRNIFDGREFRQAVDKNGDIICGYFVSRDGRVGSEMKKHNYDKAASYHILKPSGRKDGTRYLSVSIRGATNRRGSRDVHVMVACAWIGLPAAPDSQVNHIDGNKRNNSADNLEWTTRKGNGEHASRTGLIATGERLPHTKLTVTDVRNIRMMYMHGYDQYRLATLFRISQGSISMLLAKKTWRNVA